MTEGSPDIRLYTAKDLKLWLYHKQPVEGLSGRLISTTRANAIIHNPYVEDDDPLVAAMFDSGNLVAYTAAFPDRIGEKRVWWFSTLWCHRKYRGKGYALIVVGTLAEQYGEGNYYDMWGAEETVGIFNYLGLRSAYFSEYKLENKHIQRGSFRGELSNGFHRLHRRLCSKTQVLRKKLLSEKYRLSYTDFVDDELYAFILEHNKTDLWTRNQEMLNWVLAYSFKHQAPLKKRAYQGGYFSDNGYRYWKGGVKVYVDNNLVGFYIIRVADEEFSVKYLYYDVTFREEVFASIAEHVLELNVSAFTSRDRLIVEYLEPYKLFEKKIENQISFSYPPSFVLPADAVSQGGDGDGFV